MQKWVSEEKWRLDKHSGMEKRNIGYRMGERGTLGRGAERDSEERKMG